MQGVHDPPPSCRAGVAPGQPHRPPLRNGKAAKPVVEALRAAMRGVASAGLLCRKPPRLARVLTHQEDLHPPKSPPTSLERLCLRNQTA